MTVRELLEFLHPYDLERDVYVDEAGDLVCLAAVRPNAEWEPVLVSETAAEEK